jgi:TolB-like protein/tetratricopeptide (TPR) repeat protein
VRWLKSEGAHDIASGLSDELAEELASIPGLRVVHAPSGTALLSRADDQSVADTLGVSYLVTVSVQRHGPELEVTTRLLHAHARHALWADSRMVPVARLPETRDTLVGRIASTLGLSCRHHRGSAWRPPAEEWLLFAATHRARRELSTLTEEGFDRAILLTTQALGALGDDEYVLTTCGQAHLPHIMLGTRADERHLAQAEWCAARALALNPESVRGRVLRGLVRLRQGNVRGCADDLKVALQTDPNNGDALFWLTLVYVISGRGDQARPFADRLIAADPLNSTNRCVPGYIEAHRGFFEDARPHYETMFRLEPENLANRWCYTQLLVRAGRATDACAVMESIIADAPTTAVTRQTQVLLPALRGERAAARRAVTDRLRKEARWDEHGSWWLACALTLAKETDEALTWLENAVRLGYIDEPFLSRIDPCLEGLRGTRRFCRIMEQAARAYDRFDG